MLPLVPTECLIPYEIGLLFVLCDPCGLVADLVLQSAVGICAERMGLFVGDRCRDFTETSNYLRREFHCLD